MVLYALMHLRAHRTRFTDRVCKLRHGYAHLILLATLTAPFPPSVLSLGVLSLGVFPIGATDSWAQEFPKYERSKAGFNKDGKLGKAEDLVERRWNYAFDNLDRNWSVGEKASRMIRDEIAVDNRHGYDRIAVENPLDKNDGHESEWRKEYTRYDSYEVLLHPETAAACFEPRMVPVGSEYDALCRLNCRKGYLNQVVVNPQCTPCTPELYALGLCRRNLHYVVERYFPFFQVAVNKSGSRSLDVNGFSGEDSNPQFTRSGTIRNRDNNDKSNIQQLLKKLGFTEDWQERQYPQEFKLQRNLGSMDVLQENAVSMLSYQTNVHVNATRARPGVNDYYKGYNIEERCMFSSLDNPKKKIVLNASDQGDDAMSYLYLANEFAQTRGFPANWYEATVNLPQNIRQAGVREAGDMPNGMEHSYRMSKWAEFYRPLSQVSVQPANLGKAHKDTVFRAGKIWPPAAAGVLNGFDHPLASMVMAGFSFALVSSATWSPLRSVNRDEDNRPYWVTRYSNRMSEDKQGYAGSNSNLKDAIVYKDKIQILYPPFEENGRRKGSECFRVENLSGDEPPEQQTKDGLVQGGGGTPPTKDGYYSIPVDILAQFPANGLKALNRANEVRIAIWHPYLSCNCESCGVVKGCWNVHDEDVEEDVFYGNSAPPAAHAKIRGGASQPAAGGVLMEFNNSGVLERY